jgi:sugar transferase (PEP-CTERM/EpsH1 system associated)
VSVELSSDEIVNRLTRKRSDPMIITWSPGHLITLSMIPVLHLITELSIGGAQMVLLRLLSNMDRQRYGLTVACLYNGDGVVAHQIRKLGIPVIDLEMSSKWRVDAFARFWALLRQQRPTILHTWMFHANIPGRLLGRAAGVPVIIGSEHTMGQESQLRQQLNRWSGPLTNGVICVSEQVRIFAEQQIGLPPQKLTVIPNGVELHRFDHLPTQAEARRRLGLPGTTTIMGAIGRPRPVKGYRYLIDAFAQLAPSHRELNLLLVGNGAERTALVEQARQSSLADRVIFLDDQTDIPALLPALDLLVAPSLWEGMPMVVLEAMAAALPVVATRVGGTPDVVVDGKTGLLVAPADVTLLAHAIERLLQDPSLRQQMGRAGRARVERNFSIEQNVAQTQALYEQLMRNV